MPTPANAYSTRPEQSKPVVPEPEPMPLPGPAAVPPPRSEEHTSELQSQSNLVCRLLLEKKKNRLDDITMTIIAPILGNNVNVSREVGGQQRHLNGYIPRYTFSAGIPSLPTHHRNYLVGG